jgi:hypothetical protein
MIEKLDFTYFIGHLDGDGVLNKLKILEFINFLFFKTNLFEANDGASVLLACRLWIDLLLPTFSTIETIGLVTTIVGILLL